MNNRLGFILRLAKYFVIVLIFPLFSTLNSCKEDTGGVGANVLPKSDLISAYQSDTFSVLTSMYLKDTVPTNGILYSPLGSYNDPIFGQTKASLYVQVYSPAGATTTFIPWDTGNAVVDSAILMISLENAYYGNLDPQTFVVDTVSAVMRSKAYYSDTSLKYGASPIGIQQVTPKPATDSLKIKLSKSWLNYIVGKIAANPNYYTTFDSLVRGLYITVSNPLQLPGQGGILYTNLYSSSAGIYFYYHYPLSDSVEYYDDFPVGGASGIFFNHFDHNYATTPFYNTHPSGKRDSINGNNLIYVQNMGGVLGRINFPNLYKNWTKLRPVLINEAEVDISVDAQDLSTSFGPPSQLYLYGTNSSWVPYGLPDEGYSYYGGTYNASNNTYTFGITQYIQGVIDGKDTDRGLFIIPAYQATTANRVVLYGAQHDELPTGKAMKLKIYYTPLKP